VAGAPGEPGGVLYLMDDNGNRLKTIPAPASPSYNFGYALQEIGTNGWFAVGSPYQTVTTTINGVSTNYASAGTVYLYDNNGNYQQSIPNPRPNSGDYFGLTLGRAGKGRFIVGSYAKASNTVAGVAHLYNTEGLRLATIENPAPADYDAFSGAVAGVGEEYFVIGASMDDTKAVNAGSAYLYHAPIVEFYLGKEIAPPVNANVPSLPVTGPVVTPTGATFWHNPSRKLYSTKTGPILVAWPMSDSTTNYVQGINVWPTNSADYQIHIAGSLPVALTGFEDPGETELLETDPGTGADWGTVHEHVFMADNPGRSLLRLSTGSPQSSEIFFQVIKSVAWNDPAFLHTNAPATIGMEITDQFGYHDPSCGGPLVMQTASVFCPAVYDRATRSGSIIAVNTDKPGVPTDDLVLVYYQKGTRLKNGEGLNVASQIDWPWKPVRYNPQWPINPPVIVIASQKGTDLIDPVVCPNWNLYSQNNSNLAGFNPNDEHALIRPYASGNAIFALRDDLGSTNTSLPYVLMTYDDPVTGAGKMKVWKVVAEQAPNFFTYKGEAGKLIQPPFPLSVLSLCDENTGVSGPYWRDRKRQQRRCCDALLLPDAAGLLPAFLRSAASNEWSPPLARFARQHAWYPEKHYLRDLVADECAAVACGRNDSKAQARFAWHQSASQR
jgi:hypothetical protein